ncbi:hypothetical protein DOTSEDRAFT_74701 [Dothistroma septosporum NZE10]|uniref:Uncharacterized protein n=1 Tax=Dothistroma septosporum (strain NZE10 / CBS 128990) TaxID=675120 RepID=N1PF30_DOTSN|nr:hypothetical protein DOTSEDRAFT_74701 [Dothistroma septosporum NZE10]
MSRQDSHLHIMRSSSRPGEFRTWSLMKLSHLLIKVNALPRSQDEILPTHVRLEDVSRLPIKLTCSQCLSNELEYETYSLRHHILRRFPDVEETTSRPSPTIIAAKTAQHSTDGLAARARCGIDPPTNSCAAWCMPKLWRKSIAQLLNNLGEGTVFLLPDLLGGLQATQQPRPALLVVYNPESGRGKH